MSSRVFGVAALTVALALSVTACDDAATVGTASRAGTVSVLLTDAPGDVVEAWVTITDIYFQGRADGDPETGRVFLMEGGAETHELLSLSNSVAELVREVAVPTGTYGQLRMVISDGCIVTEDGRVYSSSAGYDPCGPRTGVLHMPSMAQSGAKVNLNGFTVSSGDHAILLDFDVSQSFGRQAGQSGRWVMNPVIHGAQIQHAAAIMVTLSAGDVELPEGFELEDFSVTVTPAEGDESTITFAEVDDAFRAHFRFLMADNGPFDVWLNAPEGLIVTVEPASPQTVHPASAETAFVDWVLTSAEEEEDEEEEDDDG